MELASEPKIETSDWYQDFSERNWEDVTNPIFQGLSNQFNLVIKEFHDELKLKIESKKTLQNTKISSFLEKVRASLPVFFENLANELTNIPEANLEHSSSTSLLEPAEKLEKTTTSIEETKNITENPPRKDSQLEDEKEQVLVSEISEEIAQNLFSRIVEIFNYNNQSLADLYKSLDVNKDGNISFNELRASILLHDNTITIEECRAVFDILDGNKDGSISIEELTKRFRLIQEKADEEKKDPLSCKVFSRPLDPSLIHGNLSIMLLKAQGLKTGTHNVKIRIKDSLEYVSPDTIELNPVFNFRCEFFFENQKEGELPAVVEVELYNKGKIEGTSSFQWVKARNAPNEFSFKIKTEMKTSTGQSRGHLFFQLMWTPIIVKLPTPEELKKLEELEMKAQQHRELKKELELQNEAFAYRQKSQEEIEIYEETERKIKELDEEIENSYESVPKQIGYIYMIKKTLKTVEIDPDSEIPEQIRRRTLDTDLLKNLKKGETGSKKAFNAKEMKKALGSKIPDLAFKKK